MRFKNDLEEWGKLGSGCKVARDLLMGIRTQAVSMCLDKKTTASLLSALKHLSRFRCRAEDKMFKEGVEDSKVFYGDSSDISIQQIDEILKKGRVL